MRRQELRGPRPVRPVGVGGRNRLCRPRRLEVLDCGSNRRDNPNRLADMVRSGFSAKKLRRGGEV